MGLAAVIHRVFHMFSTDLSTIALVFVAVVTLCVAVWGWFVARRAQKYASDCATYVAEANKRSQSLRRIAELEGALTELADSYHALLKSHKKLRSRIGMRELRKKRKGAQNGAEAPENPEYELPEVPMTKQQLRVECKKSGILK